MFSLLSIFLCAFTTCVVSNRVFPPTKVIRLTLGVSKATYLPLSSKRFIQDGSIMENPTTILPRVYLGFIFLPPKYDASKDKIACSVKKWTAKSYENRETEVLMFTNVQQKLVVFGFRGTEALNPTDWFHDFKIFLVPLTIGERKFLIHWGFKLRYGYIAAWFENEYKQIPRDYTIIITGHSLGGAEATVAAVYAAGKLKRRPDAVVTYGSLLVGDQGFKNYYNQVVGCDRTLRITAKGDSFTVFPSGFGYTHVCDKFEVDGQTGGDLLKSHDLYGGYDKGIKRKYHDHVNDINFGCDQIIV